MYGFRPLFVALVVLALAPRTGAADDPALRAAAALYDGIITETLPNGLRVVSQARSRRINRHHDDGLPRRFGR